MLFEKIDHAVGEDDLDINFGIGLKELRCYRENMQTAKDDRRGDDKGAFWRQIRESEWLSLFVSSLTSLDPSTVWKQSWLAAVAVGSSIVVIQLIDTLHPPAGINALLIVTANLSWKFVLRVLNSYDACFASASPPKAAAQRWANSANVVGLTPNSACVLSSTHDSGWRRRSAACSSRASTMNGGSPAASI